MIDTKTIAFPDTPNKRQRRVTFYDNGKVCISYYERGEMILYCLSSEDFNKIVVERAIFLGAKND